MIRNQNIICFAPYGWNWKTYGSCKRFMNLLSRENRILYINNIQFIMPKVKTIGPHAFVKRMARKFESITKPFLRVDRSLHVYTPLMFPHYGSPIKRRLNKLLLRGQLRFLQKALRFYDPIVWIENPIGMIVLKDLNPAFTVYYRIDKFESHHELRNPKEIVDLDESLTREADIILCVSLKLYEEKLAMRKKGVHYLPHGVDFEHFHSSTKSLPLPEDMKKIRHPIIGYFGTLDTKNDHSLIHYCATQRPDLSFVLIGEIGSRHEGLQRLPNVYFLGYKDYAQLPSYGQAFDVCIMFWKATEWIKYCHPVKIMEFLAMGKPVVSVAFEEVSRRYKGFVTLARNGEEFLRGIEEEISHDSEAKRQARIDFVRKETWEARVEYVSQLIPERVRL